MSLNAKEGLRANQELEAEQLTFHLQLNPSLPVLAGLAKDEPDYGPRGSYTVVASAGAIPATRM